MNFTDIRLRVRRFLRNYRVFIFVFLIVWVIIFAINSMLKNRKPSDVPDTSYEAHTSIMNSSSTVPKSLQKTYQEYIDEYVEYVNNGEFEKAYDMVSQDCRDYQFRGNFVKYMAHLKKTVPTPKQHVIQDYSNFTLYGRNNYVYQVKYFDDVLSTGLTDLEYSYTDEKVVFSEDELGNVQMGVDGFISFDELKRIAENEYLKVDVVSRVVNYEYEEYQVKFTNRSDYTIVIYDDTETDEIDLELSGETRERQEVSHIVLPPNESVNEVCTFFKYADDGDTSKFLLLNNVRVMEVYSGAGEEIPAETIQNEKNNAVAKFSMSVGLE